MQTNSGSKFETDLTATEASEDATARADANECSRRSWLMGAGALAATAGTAHLLWDQTEHFQRSATVITRASSYAASLVDTIRDGLKELGFDRKRIHGKVVLLKPNLVEPTREAPHVNTNPTVVQAAAEVFRSWDAKEVLVAEGQGHVRDAWLVLEQSGMEPMLKESSLEFVDLNHDDVVEVDNAMGKTSLKSLFLPRTLQRADVIVSIPKMKTHHWAGVTLSMKNLFGVLPGICYGWPKNVLHHCGISQSIVDINATVRPHLAIVDGIVGMEGDGPIMGTPCKPGLLVMGTNLTAVDATATRLMGFHPEQLEFLRLASGRLGPIKEHHIQQRGELIGDCTYRFRLGDHSHFRQFRS